MNIFRKRRIEKDLERYASLEDEEAPLRKEGVINFLLFQVQDDQISAVKALFDQIVEIAVNRGAVIGDRLSSIGLVYYGVQEASSNEPQNLAENILTMVDAGRVKILGGSAAGKVENFGSSGCMLYGPYLNRTDDVLKDLLDREYGSMKIKSYI